MPPSKRVEEDLGAHPEPLRETVTNKPSTSESLSSSNEARNIAAEKYLESDFDKGIVGWEGQDDPLNPRYVHLLSNLLVWQIIITWFRWFPESRKWMLLGFVSANSFLR